MINCDFCGEPAGEATLFPPKGTKLDLCDECWLEYIQPVIDEEV